MAAAGTIGTLPAVVGYPTLCSSSQRTTPAAASSPKALPPVSTMAFTRSTRLTGSSKSVSRVAGAAPRCDTPPTASPSTTTTVQPVGLSVRVKCPTLMPDTAVSVRFDVLDCIPIVRDGFIIVRPTHSGAIHPGRMMPILAPEFQVQAAIDGPPLLRY